VAVEDRPLGEDGEPGRVVAEGWAESPPPPHAVAVIAVPSSRTTRRDFLAAARGTGVPPRARVGPDGLTRWMGQRNPPGRTPIPQFHTPFAAGTVRSAAAPPPCFRLAVTGLPGRLAGACFSWQASERGGVVPCSARVSVSAIP
jgi:hypothetical protein